VYAQGIDMWIAVQQGVRSRRWRGDIYCLILDEIFFLACNQMHRNCTGEGCPFIFMKSADWIKYLVSCWSANSVRLVAEKLKTLKDTPFSPNLIAWDQRDSSERTCNGLVKRWTNVYVQDMIVLEEISTLQGHEAMDERQRGRTLIMRK
jgi:hypothetical protein